MTDGGFSWAHLGLIATGGAVGTALRAGILLVEDPATTLSIPAINVVGAFALGVLTSILTRAGDTARTRALRQLFGAGVLGGFTTYSTLAGQTAAGDPAQLLVAAATVVAGIGAAWLGLLGGRIRR